MKKSWIRAENIYRLYRRGNYEIRAVDGVNLTVEKGDFLGIVGASGSGKSTLLNLLAGLDTPSAGEIYFKEKPLSGRSRKELASYRSDNSGIIFQSFNLLHHRTALANVEMGLYFSKLSSQKRKEKAKAMLVKLGLEKRLDHRPVDLSGGEQQRVAVARALVKEPDVLFADEPTGNLDKKNSEQICNLLKDLNDDGLTIVLITHDTAITDVYAKRILRMDYGLLKDNGGDAS
jgi:putative ABC transport system ATP-binding protein